MKVDILAIGVHPDDVELSCSGTLLSHIDQGYSVGLCDLTAGELGTRGTAKIRLREAENARVKMGAKFRINLEMEDGFIQATKENTLKVIEVIRMCRPSIVLANAISDRHPDHGRAAKLVADAAFYSGLRKIETHDEKGQSQEAFRPNVVYHYVQDRNTTHDFVVDISKYFEKKIELILTFESQFFNPDNSEPETPISSKSFMDYMRAKNQIYARDIGTEFAEAFSVNRDIGVRNLFALV